MNRIVDAWFVMNVKSDGGGRLIDRSTDGFVLNSIQEQKQTSTQPTLTSFRMSVRGQSDVHHKFNLAARRAESR